MNRNRHAHARGRASQLVASYRPEQSTALLTVAVDDLDAELVALLASAGRTADPERRRALLASVTFPGGPIPIHGTIMLQGTITGDGRTFDTGGGSTRELPLPLMSCLETSFGHDGAEPIGRIDTITIGSDARIPYTGVILDTDEGREVAALIAARSVRGISADLDNMVVEYAVTEWDDDGFPCDYEMHATEWRIMGATITPFPAFAECNDTMVDGVTVEGMIDVGDDGDAGEGDSAEMPMAPAAAADGEHVHAAPIAASSALIAPPARFFLDPELPELTAPILEANGHYYGHLASWDECHTGYLDVCVCAPHSASDYAYFLTGAVLADDGHRYAVGQITLGGEHAGDELGYREAVDHYADAGTAAADVAVGEDDHGIWFSGMVRPNLDDLQRHALQAHALSGDWRPIGTGLELVATLCVNSPGFPVPRARVASGRVVALIASSSAGRLAQLMRQRNEPPTREEFDAMAARLAKVEGRASSHERQLGQLAPGIRAGVRARL